ncbi:MAG: DUF1566 domain-containing protein [Deltaproteobacteria bacterium]|jgi:hypothetical protein|nr:DUF1566 domain-containing protein [Deltaproteobacteria bacterium]
MFRYLFTTLVILAAGILIGEAPVLAGDRFVDNGDGTVTDRQQNLMWSKTDNQGDINWIDAEKWVRFTFPDTIQKRYDNWRLPTLAELQSLLNEDKIAKGYETECGQWVKTVPEIRLSCGWVWTSETDPIAPTARIFNFDNVYHYTVRKAHNRGYRALPVRNIK